jgi:hypothetical protein
MGVVDGYLGSAAGELDGDALAYPIPAPVTSAFFPEISFTG